MKYKNIVEGRKHKNVDKKEKCDTNCNIMVLTSTPVKVNERRSVSLLDITDIEPSLENAKINVSSDTLGSSSSIFKDSGYNQSESSISSDKAKEETFQTDFRGEYFRLLEDSKFKDIMITSLYESNHSLRLQLAEAENKITELRLRSESHCKCCTLRPADNPSEFKSSEKVSPNFKYSISSFNKSDSCLVVPAPNIEQQRSKPSPVHSPLQPNDDTYIKVQQWQHSFQECKKNLVSNPLISAPNSSVDTQKVYHQLPPEPLPQNMSYMETSRALAEAYQKRQAKSPELFSFQVIGDHSVAIAPLQLVRERQAAKAGIFSSEYGKNKYNCKEDTQKEVNDHLPSRQSILSNILFRNQELQRRNAIFDTFPLLKFQTHSLNTRSSDLFECLIKANEYATSLAAGLSRLPDTLDDIRSISIKRK